MADFPVPADILKRLRAESITVSDKFIDISETRGDERGLGTLILQVEAPCVRLRLPETPIRWLATQKCADAIVFEFSGEKPVLHLVELKSAMTPGGWKNVKEQLSGAYHNALAVGGVLHLAEFAAIRAHVACREDRIRPDATASPSTLKLGLGLRLPDGVSDWIARRFTLDGVANVPLSVILRDADGNASAHLKGP
jgi:hypothetical protein